jgi:general stress protein 26
MDKTIQQIKEEAWGWFEASQMVFLATAEMSQPRVRPVTVIDHDDTLWIATGTRSQKARQIRHNPNVELCLPIQSGNARGYVRVAGVAECVADEAMREEIGRRFGYFGEYWSGPEDPDYTLLRITRVEVEYLAPGETDAVTFIV